MASKAHKVVKTSMGNSSQPPYSDLSDHCLHEIMEFMVVSSPTEYSMKLILYGFSIRVRKEVMFNGS